MRQAVREQFAGLAEAIALDAKLRYDHGSQFMSDDLRRPIRFLGMASSPALARDPEGNGTIARFLRTLKQQLPRVSHFETLQELAQALKQFRQRYDEQWLTERLHLQSQRQAHLALLAFEPAP